MYFLILFDESSSCFSTLVFKMERGSACSYDRGIWLRTRAHRDIVAAHLCLLCFFYDSRMLLVGISGTDDLQLGTWYDEKDDMKLNNFS